MLKRLSNDDVKPTGMKYANDDEYNSLSYLCTVGYRFLMCGFNDCFHDCNARVD